MKIVAGLMLAPGCLLREARRIPAHVDPSPTELLDRTVREICNTLESRDQGVPGAEGRLVQAENWHAELLAWRERRRRELTKR